jgi:K+-sensing histidine kinase KdpD
MAEIKLEQEKEPAKLRIYIGAAPGVGKTYDMLNDAYLMRSRASTSSSASLKPTAAPKPKP